MAHLVGGISSAGRAVPDIDGVPFRVARAEGAHIVDDRGNAYIDTALGFGATLLGHANPVVNRAVTEAIANGSMPAFAHAAEERAAADLCAHTGPLDRVVFTNSGSEAVHLAARVARAVTGRGVIAKVGAGFDGWFDDFTLANAGSPEAEWHLSGGGRPLRGGTTVVRFNDVDDICALFDERDDIAAVIAEPILANAGCLVPDPNWLETVQALCRRNGALFIADEVLMGFREHLGLSSHKVGLDPDMATIGKSVGNGFVVAGVVGRADIMKAAEDGRAQRAGTYCGNPVATAAVSATLSEMAHADYAALSASTHRLRAAIEQAAPGIRTTGRGPVFTTWFAARPPASYESAARAANPDMTRALHIALRRRGVMTMPFPFGRVFLSFSHTDQILDRLEAAYLSALAEVAEPAALARSE